MKFLENNWQLFAAFALLLCLFSFNAHALTISCEPPTTRADGSALAAGDLGEFRLYQGDTDGALSLSSSSKQCAFDVQAGQVYALTVTDSNGIESERTRLIVLIPPSPPVIISVK